MPEGTEFNSAAPFSMVVRSQNADVLSIATTTEIDLSVYYCKKGSEALCYFRDSTVSVPVVVAEDGATQPGITIGVQAD